MWPIARRLHQRISPYLSEMAFIVESRKKKRKQQYRHTGTTRDPSLVVNLYLFPIGERLLIPVITPPDRECSRPFPPSDHKSHLSAIANRIHKTRGKVLKPP